jgi:hypothetical protein
VVLGTPVGDIVSNFSPYYGEVGKLNTGKAVFPPLVHQDVVQRKEALVNPEPDFFHQLASDRWHYFYSTQYMHAFFSTQELRRI